MKRKDKVCLIDLGNGLEVWDGKEYWCEIEGFDGKYSVSTFGRVWNNEYTNNNVFQRWTSC